MKIYRIENSIQAFYSAVFLLYQEKNSFQLIRFSKNEEQSLFESQEIFLPTETNGAERVYKALLEKTGEEVVEKIEQAFYSELSATENELFSFVKLAFTYRETILNRLSEPLILKVLQRAQRTAAEAHRFLGLVRFREIDQNLFYAEIKPDTNVLPVIKEHFHNRYLNQNWIIHDINRDFALLQKDRECVYAPFQLNFQYGSYTNENYAILWKEYCKCISIEDRENRKLQQQNLPKKYWKQLPELRDSLG